METVVQITRDRNELIGTDEGGGIQSTQHYRLINNDRTQPYCVALSCSREVIITGEVGAPGGGCEAVCSGADNIIVCFRGIWDIYLLGAS